MKKKSRIIIVVTIFSIIFFASYSYASDQNNKFVNTNSIFEINSNSNILVEDKYEEYYQKINDDINENINIEFQKNSEKVKTDKDIIDEVVENLKVRKLKLDNNLLNDITTIENEINFGEETFYFETFDVDGKRYIQGKPFTNTPSITNTKEGNGFIFEYNLDLYSIDPYSLAINKITKDSYMGIPKEEFLKEIKYLYWASSPSISFDGKKITYYSNISITDNKIIAKDGIWMYSFTDNAEKLLLDSSIIEEGYTLGSDTYWLNNEEFIYKLYSSVISSSIKFMKYNIITNEHNLLLDYDSSTHYEDKFLVYRNKDNINVFDILNNKNYEFYLPPISNESEKAVSEKGKVAIPYGDKIAVLDINSNNISTFEIPDNYKNYVIQDWIDEGNLLVRFWKKGLDSSWILNTKEDVK